MKRLIAAVVLVSFAIQTFAADPILLVTKKGYYYLTEDADGLPITKAVPSVIVLGQPGDQPAPPPPTGTTLKDQIASTSKTIITENAEAAALATVLKAFVKEADAGRLTDANVQRTLEISLPVADLGVEAGGRFTKWLQAVSKLQGFTYTKVGLQAMVDGLTQAYNLPAGALDAVVDQSVDGFHEGKTAEEVGESLKAAFADAAFDPTLIITLIMKILELLQNLGIFG